MSPFKPSLIVATLCVVSLLGGNFADGQKIQLFEHMDYGGFEHDSTITTSCETLPHRYQNKVSSIKTEKCVILFSHNYCEGREYRVEAGENRLLSDFHDDTDSFRSCEDISEESPYRDYRTKLYEDKNYGKIISDWPITDGCQNVPDWARNKATSIRTDVCVNLYALSDCQGAYFRVERGEVDNLSMFNDDTDSFIPCDVNEIMKDYRLTVQINRLEIFEGPNDNSRVEDLDMGATQIFRNNGSATIVQKYVVERDVKETVELERVVGTHDFHRFYVDIDANFDYSLGIPVIAQTKISASIKTGYLFMRNETEEISERYRNETLKSFRVEQDLHIPACRYYEVNSIVKLRADFPVEYIAHAYVTGEYTGKKLEASEIKSRLPDDIQYVKDVDETTVEVQFRRTLTADFGLYTETNADGYPLEDCIAMEETKGEPEHLRFININ